jgi:hypothetical protein
VPDSGRAKRAPPTIDLEASEVSGETQPAARDAPPEPAEEAQPNSEPKSKSTSKPISPWVIAPASGAVAAALVIAIGWMLGWPPVQTTPPAAPPINAAAIDDITARLAGLESKLSKPAARVPDPAAAARIDALEKSVAALRGDLADLRAQSQKLASAAGEAQSPSGAVSSSPDLAALTARIDQIERASRAPGAEIARAGEEIASKPADDLALRRVVAATLLDVAVRHGDPYQAALSTAKSLSPNADSLKPLDAFASTGVPNPAMLSRELLTLVPKLSPPAPENSTAGSSIVDRLQAGAARLVRIERTDGVGNDRGAVVARVTAAALRNDLAEARRELDTLSPTDRTAAQPWLDKAAARDAALAASRQFANDAMADLAKPAQ